MSRRVVVTGAAGFIGSHLCEALISAGDEVVGIDTLTDYYDPARKRENLAPSLRAGLVLHEVDLCDHPLEPLLDGAEVVFHLAAQPGVRGSFGAGFAAYADRNLLATQRVLEASLATSVGRFVFASSSSVYGNAGGRAIRETHPHAPASPYGLTKAACENLIDVYRRCDGISATSLRYFTVFGPRQRPEMAFALFIDRILEGRPIPIFGDGRQSRDFTYVADVVRATIAAGERGDQHAYNIAGGGTTTLLDALEIIERLTGRRAVVERQADARGDVRHTRADISAAMRDLGYRPVTTVADGLDVQTADELRRRGAARRAVARDAA